MVLGDNMKNYKQKIVCRNGKCIDVTYKADADYLQEEEKFKESILEG